MGFVYLVFFFFLAFVISLAWRLAKRIIGCPPEPAKPPQPAQKQQERWYAPRKGIDYR
jgi:Na+-transporting methylmalonyl-CoA/oxaloacetate decarboxylase gamma subunit